MELSILLEVIRNEFPDKSIDISESLDLLLGTIDDIIKLSNARISEALSERDFSTGERYMELIKSINVYENKIDEIINLTRVEEADSIEENNEETIIKEIPNYEEYIVDNEVEHTLYENFTHIRPFGFRINTSELIEIRTWQEMLLKTCEIFIAIDSEKFVNFENNKIMNGKKNKYFSVKPNGLRKPEKVADKIYVETNMSSNSIRYLILKILKEYDIKVSNYKVYFRADYTNINR